ncbi:MAG TPA: hypothetical protein VF095_02580 [Bacillota bacterium]
MHTYAKSIVVILSLILLSGCLYPDEELEKNKTPNEDQLKMVQEAVTAYQEDNNGLVPIKTKPSDTGIFEKYLIDFTKLKEANEITEIPGTAYENGGVYQYALLDPEDNPQVKLIDLRMTEEIRSVNVQLDIYREKNLYPPFGEEIADGIYTIDYEQLNMDSAPHVNSPYSDNNLPIVMDIDGKLYVDYRIDLNNALKEYEHEYEEGDDIRYILAENTPFLPAYSLPYTIKNGEPVFLEK